MRTLVYCTAYAATVSGWQTRYRRWLDAVLTGGLNVDQVLIVDDGSATLPGWPELSLYSGDELGEGFTVGPRGPVLLYHFRKHLGRPELLNFPGWHRSYVFGALYAEANGFDRVIHLESDAYLISQRARDFVMGYRDGWAAPWSAHYDMPEMAISVAAGDGLRKLAQFARQPYAALAGRIHERVMPFTHVEKTLKGERYGDTAAPVPKDADFAAQVHEGRLDSYYWWLPGQMPRAVPAQSVMLRFGEGGNGNETLDGGWAAPEPEFHWMLGAESILRLPALPGTPDRGQPDGGQPNGGLPDGASKGDAALRLGVVPHVVAGKLERQRLMVVINGHRIEEFDVVRESVLECTVPACVLRAQGTNLVRLIHPDAVAPAMLDTRNSDQRRLSLRLEWLTFER